MNKLTSFEDHLDKHRGRKGTISRAKFDADSLLLGWVSCFKRHEKKPK